MFSSFRMFYHFLRSGLPFNPVGMFMRVDAVIGNQECRFGYYIDRVVISRDAFDVYLENSDRSFRYEWRTGRWSTEVGDAYLFDLSLTFCEDHYSRRPRTIVA